MKRAMPILTIIVGLLLFVVGRLADRPDERDQPTTHAAARSAP